MCRHIRRSQAPWSHVFCPREATFLCVLNSRPKHSRACMSVCVYVCCMRRPLFFMLKDLAADARHKISAKNLATYEMRWVCSKMLMGLQEEIMALHLRYAAWAQISARECGRSPKSGLGLWAPRTRWRSTLLAKPSADAADGWNPFGPNEEAAGLDVLGVVRLWHVSSTIITGSNPNC